MYAVCAPCISMYAVSLPFIYVLIRVHILYVYILYMSVSAFCIANTSVYSVSTVHILPAFAVCTPVCTVCAVCTRACTKSTQCVSSMYECLCLYKL
jgi:hypothetical protein